MRPRRLRLTTARAWACSNEWTPTRLGGSLGKTLLQVKTSQNDPHFMYTASGRDAELLCDRIPHSHTSSVRAQTFLSSLRDGPPYEYYTAPLVGDDPLTSMVPGWEALALHSGTNDELQFACRPWAQWWAGSGGAVTQCHYDVADNVFVQLHGRKEFRLYPPDAACSLHVFPDAHPRARKSQVCIEQPDLERHSLAAALCAPLRVVLEPGDALMIPAFWFHHVTALTPSLSVNVFSESPVKLRAAELLGWRPPLHASWPDEIKRVGLGSLITQLLSEPALKAALAAAGAPPRALLHRHFASRFHPLRHVPADGHARGVGLGHDGSGSASAAGDSSVPSGTPRPRTATARRRRRSAMPSPSSVAELQPALDEHSRLCAEGFARLAKSVGLAASSFRDRFDGEAIEWGKDEGGGTGTGAAATLLERTSPWDDDDDAAAYLAGVSTLTTMHLLELWTLHLFGPERLDQELSRALEYDTRWCE